MVHFATQQVIDLIAVGNRNFNIRFTSLARKLLVIFVSEHFSDMRSGVLSDISISVPSK